MFKATRAITIILLTAMLLSSAIPVHMDTTQPVTPGGGIALSFDNDVAKSIANWYKLQPLLDQYNAHVTFYVAWPQNLNATEATELQALQADGNEIGDHGENHTGVIDHIKLNHTAQDWYNVDVMPTFADFQKKGLGTPTSFAYPQAERNADSDNLLNGTFVNARGVDQNRAKPMPNRTCYFDFGKQAFVINAAQIDLRSPNGAYDTSDADIIAGMDYARSKGKVLVLFAHDIAPSNNTTLYKTTTMARIQMILQYARDNGMKFYTMSQLVGAPASTRTPTPTATPTPTVEAPTATPLPSDTPTSTPIPFVDSPTPTPTVEAPTATPLPSDTPTSTPIPFVDSPTPTPTVDSPTPTPTVDSPTPTPTVDSPTPTPTVETPTVTPTDTPTATPIPIVADTPTPTPVPSQVPTITPTPKPTTARFEPANGTCYVGLYCYDNLVGNFTNATGKKPALREVFAWFAVNSTFLHPGAHSDWGLYDINAIGCTPVITWQPDLITSMNQTGYTDLVPAIANGTYDDYIRARADECKAFGKPVFIRFCHEANGYWYPWNKHPQEVINASQRVYTIFKQEGADNVAFVWCPTYDTWKDRPTPNWDAYYPGDAYVDWVGLDIYNIPVYQRNITTFLDRFYSEFAGRKPIMLGEVGCDENMSVAANISSDTDARNKAQWIHDLFAALNTKYPRVKAFNYFSVYSGTNCWILKGVTPPYAGKTDLQWYKYFIADPRYLSTVAY